MVSQYRQREMGWLSGHGQLSVTQLHFCGEEGEGLSAWVRGFTEAFCQQHCHFGIRKKTIDQQEYTSNQTALLGRRGRVSVVAFGEGCPRVTKVARKVVLRMPSYRALGAFEAHF